MHEKVRKKGKTDSRAYKNVLPKPQKTFSRASNKPPYYSKEETTFDHHS